MSDEHYRGNDPYLGCGILLIWGALACFGIAVLVFLSLIGWKGF